MKSKTTFTHFLFKDTVKSFKSLYLFTITKIVFPEGRKKGIKKIIYNSMAGRESNYYD